LSEIKGRGAQKKTGNKFLKNSYHHHLDWDYENDEPSKTRLFFESPKEIVNKVLSPDVPMGFSINPYQGCEHGCVYCYARNSHQYWGFGAGLEFEQNIIIKKNAPELLRKKFNTKAWKGDPVMLSGNTDCYQPLERKFKITQELLKVCYEFKNPVGIITKNRLITRDIEILKVLAKENLTSVNISINSSNEILIRKLEPRTSTYKQRLHTIEYLSNAGIKVSALLAPIIPGLNNTEIPKILKDCANAGAINAGYIVVRLNGDVAKVFDNWVYQEYPQRAKKILSQISSLHGGKLNDSRYKTRMKGEGEWAKIIKSQFKLFYKMYFPNPEKIHFNTNLFSNQQSQNQLKFNF